MEAEELICDHSSQDLIYDFLNLNYMCIFQEKFEMKAERPILGDNGQGHNFYTLENCENSNI